MTPTHYDCSCGHEDSDGRGDVLRCPIHGIGPDPKGEERDRIIAHAHNNIRVNESIPPVDEEDVAYKSGYVQALDDLIEWLAAGS